MFFKIPKQEIIQPGEMQASDKAAMKKESRRLFVIVIVLVAVFFAALAAIFLFRPADVYGNTSGNLWNGGLFAENSGWIYYYSNGGKCLYKARPDGTEKTKLVDGFCLLINIADGCIYYVDGKNSSLCKIRTDGTGFTKLDDYAKQLFVENGWLYYSNKYIYKMRTDGSEKIQLSSSRVDVINISDGWIYFVNMREDSFLRKMRTDGTDVTKLNVMTWPGIVSGDYIYYASGPFLFKIREDGTDDTILSKECNQSFNISNDFIYYKNKKDNCIHKMRTDGTEDVKLNDSNSSMIYITGGWIYYYNMDDALALYRMKTDGTENQPVE